MKMPRPDVRCVTWTAIVGAVVLTTSCCSPKPNLGGIEGSLKEAGYQMYYPARSDWGPGTAFAGKLADGRISIDTSFVCTNIFLNFEPHAGATVQFAINEGTTNREFSVGLGILEKVFGAGVLPKLGVSTAGTSDFKVSISNAREYTLWESDSYIEGKDEEGYILRPIRPECLKALDERKKRGTLDEVYLVVRAVQGEIAYDMRDSEAFAGNADLTVKKVIGVSTEGKWKETGKTSFVVTGDNNTPLYIASAAPKRLLDWLPSGLVAGDFRKFKLGNVEFDGYGDAN